MKILRIDNKKLRDSAEDKPCQMMSPDCNHNPTTTVWCHSNMQRHGKGKGIKSHDCFGFYGCSGCHHWYDESGASKEEKEIAFYAAFERTLVYLFASDILEINK